MVFNSRTILNSRKTLLVLAAAVAVLPAAAQAQSVQFVPVITTYAGGGAATVANSPCAVGSAYTATDTVGDGCPATLATLASPHIGDSDAAGNYYFPDTTNNVVRRIDAVTGVVTIFAGGATTVCSAKTDTVGDGCPATQATLNQPKGLRVDAFGNVVIADLNNERIRSVNATTGIITTIVGSGTKGTGVTTNGTIANAAKLYSPFDVAFDKSGNLYISDYYDNQIVLVTAVNGAISPTASLAYDLAGNGQPATAGTAGESGDGGIASAAEVNEPRGLTVDSNGNIYVADFVNSYVRKITSPFQNGTLNLNNAIISLYAGNGTDGYLATQDGSAPTSAEVAAPQGVAVDAAGVLYIAQYGSGFDVIRTVNSTLLSAPVIGTSVGTGAAGFAGEGVAAITAKLYSPSGMSFDRFGRMLIADSTNNRVRLVQQLPFFGNTAVGSSSVASNVVAHATAAVTPKTLAVTPNSHDFTAGTMSGCTLNTAAASGAYCSIPVTFSPAAPGIRTTAVTLTDSNGTKYVTGAVGVATAPAVAYVSSTISTIAGTGTAGNSGTLASLAQVNAPRGSTIDASGSLVFADSGSNQVRRIDHTTGAISALAGTGTANYTGDGSAATSATLKDPTGVVFDPAGNLYIADTGNNVIRHVDAATGIITTVAGTGSANYNGDNGLATLATLDAPMGLAIDLAGRIYVADSGNHAVRRFAPNGYIATVAGTGTANYTGDAGQSTAATLSSPSAVAVDAAGDIFIADTGNNVIRKISPLGVISTVAGTHGVTSNSGDGAAATSAGLQSPSDVALDAAGDLYIAAGGAVRLVSTSGTISTIAGTGASGAYSGEGGAAIAAVLPSPSMNLAVDGAANVYLSETTANLVLLVSLATARTLDFGTLPPSGTSASQTVTVYNPGNLPLVLTGLTVSSKYTLQGASTCTATTTLAAGRSCTIILAFTPGTSTGTLTGSVTLTDNALNGSSVTQTIPLTGVSAVPANPTTTTLTSNPASTATITYGSSITFTAAVTGTALTGNVVFSIDGVTAGTVAVVNNQAIFTVPRIAAGHHTVTAMYTNDTVNATSSGSESISVQQAVLTVTAANASRTYGTANPAFPYTITGFLSPDTSSVVSGSAVFNSTATTNSAAGTYPIAEVSSTLSATNYSFQYVNATLTVTPPDFTLTASPTSITMAAGQAANVTITLTPLGPYQGTVTLSCGTLPQYVTCNFSSAQLVADGSGSVVSTQLVIATDNFQHITGNVPAPRPGVVHLPLITLAALPLLAFFGLRGRRKLVRMVLALVCLAAIGNMVGCANSGQNIAAKGTDTVTLTATDTGSISHNLALTVTLQ